MSMMLTPQLEAARIAVRDAIAVEYSFDEIREFSEARQRELDRAQDILEMFASLSGAARLEDACFAHYQWRLAQAREHHRFNGRVYFMRSYAKLKADPVKYAARLKYKREHAMKRRRERGLLRGYARGERVGTSTLCEAEVVEILTATCKQRDLAARFSVSPATISMIRSRQKWAHVVVPGVSP